MHLTKPTVDCTSLGHQYDNPEVHQNTSGRPRRVKWNILLGSEESSRFILRYAFTAGVVIPKRLFDAFVNLLLAAYTRRPRQFLGCP